MASPSSRLKRKAAGNAIESSTGVQSAESASTSAFHLDYAPSSAAPSPLKRQITSSASRRNSHQSQALHMSDDFDPDQDAPYDEELDADADAEYGQDYLDQDAPGEDEQDLLDAMHQNQNQSAAASPKSNTTMTPSRQSARPRRSNAPGVSYYATQPLLTFSDEEHEEEVTPSIRRRARRTQLPSTSDIDADPDDNANDESATVPTRLSSRGTHTNTPSKYKQTCAKPPRQPVHQDDRDKSAEPELSEEAKQLAKAEKESQDLQSRWTEEYFEIIEQLPLEIHRTFALMRELEGQMQSRMGTMIQNMTAYRDVRMHMQKLIDSEFQKQTQIQNTTQDNDTSRKGTKGGSEDEAEHLLGGSQQVSTNDQLPSLQGDASGVRVVTHDKLNETDLLDKDARRELLRSISLAANESVKAAEEKMGLAATAYNWIDRHIRRVDADISKLESSILLGLRTGTEESRGAREALGLPIDGTEAQARERDDEDEDEDAQGAVASGVSAEAESAALTKAAGAANRALAAEKEVTVGGRRSARTTPKMSAQAPRTPSPRGSERGAVQARSRSTSTSGVAVVAVTAMRQKTSSPAPSVARTARKRKPKPLSPQKGGRRSIVTTTSTVISPTTQTPRASAIVGPDTSEMPFDPTEPTYCYCDQISFDEMVACDNDDCTIEWFHYACVGLAKQPENEWYCRFCAPPAWKGPGMRVPPNAKHKPPGFRKGIGIKP